MFLCLKKTNAPNCGLGFRRISLFAVVSARLHNGQALAENKGAILLFSVQ
jgi:hypothetical protein